MKKIIQKLSSFPLQSFPKETTGRLSLMAFLVGCLALYADSFVSDHIPPLQKMRSDLVFLGAASIFFQVSAVLAFIALRRAKNSAVGEKLGTYRAMVGLHSLFSLLIIVGLAVGTFFYIQFQRIEKHQAEEEAGSVRAKFGEGEAYNTEMARRITWAFQKKLGEVKQRYQLAGASLTNPMVLDMSGITNAADVGYRGEIIRNFIVTATEFREFCKSSLVVYKSEVDSHLLSKSAREEILKGFVERNEKINPTVVELRDAELLKWREMLKLVTLLEKTWGQWTWDSAEGGGLTFDNDAHAKNYASLAAKIKTADSRMTELQTKVYLIQQSSK